MSYGFERHDVRHLKTRPDLVGQVDKFTEWHQHDTERGIVMRYLPIPTLLIAYYLVTLVIYLNLLVNHNYKPYNRLTFDGQNLTSILIFKQK